MPRPHEETLWLPVSKTDPQAVGCTRTWGCVCDGSHNVPCPYHAVTEQLAFLARLFPGRPLNQLPLFPQITGETADKESVVKSIEVVAERLGEPLVDQLGRRRYGGIPYGSCGHGGWPGLPFPLPP